MATSRIRTDTGPTVAVVGRPNVGKSTLVNRLTGRRDAIIEERPGVTRDRTAHLTEWRGRNFVVIDTGGWTPGYERESQGLDDAVSAQAERATTTADLVIVVTDANVGITEADAAVARWVRITGVPVALVANKVDNPSAGAVIAEMYGLGLGEPIAISALHGHGSGDLLDLVVDKLREVGAFDRGNEPAVDHVPGIALIGRPNAGKSSLFNRLVGEERTIVDDRPGTTRDAVDTIVELDDGRAYRFIDTAGLRRKTRKNDATEYYSSVRTVQALDAADVAMLVVDASLQIGEQEQRLARQVLDAGRALVLVFSKWDLVDEERRFEIAKEQDRLLNFVSWAEMVRTAGTTGRGVNRLWPALDRALESFTQRVPTARMNEWLASTVDASPPPLHAGNPVRLRYATQVAVGPPRFRVFASGEVSPQYVRYLERRLREDFGFGGTPLDVAVRVRPRWEEREGHESTGPKARKRPAREARGHTRR